MDYHGDDIWKAYYQSLRQKPTFTLDDIPTDYKDLGIICDELGLAPEGNIEELRRQILFAKQTESYQQDYLDTIGEYQDYSTLNAIKNGSFDSAGSVAIKLELDMNKNKPYSLFRINHYDNSHNLQATAHECMELAKENFDKVRNYGHSKFKTLESKIMAELKLTK